MCILLLAGCKNASENSSNNHKIPTSLQPLHQEVLAIHDEVMPRMGEISNLQEKLIARLEVLRGQEPINTDSLKQANQVLGQLNRSESAMWDWMHGFSALDSIADDRKEAFLQTNKSTATEMRDLIVNSLEEAHAFLQE